MVGFEAARLCELNHRSSAAIAEQSPSACAEIGALIGELYTIERLVPGPFPGDAAAHAAEAASGAVPPCARPHLAVGDGASRLAAERVWQGRALYARALGRLTRFVADPCVPLDNNAACLVMPPVGSGRSIERIPRRSIVADAG